MIEALKAWILTRHNRDQHLKLMADHLLTCARVIEELRAENQALKERGDALAFIFERNNWSIEMADQVALQVALWREMQGVVYD